MDAILNLLFFSLRGLDGAGKAFLCYTARAYGKLDLEIESSGMWLTGACGRMGQAGLEPRTDGL